MVRACGCRGVYCGAGFILAIERFRKKLYLLLFLLPCEKLSANCRIVLPRQGLHCTLHWAIFVQINANLVFWLQSQISSKNEQVELENKALL